MGEITKLLKKPRIQMSKWVEKKCLRRGCEVFSRKISFSEDQPSLVDYRDISLKASFVEKGCLSEVCPKGGVVA
jgi:hypothetical protein